MRYYKILLALALSAAMFPGCKDEEFRYEVDVINVKDISRTEALLVGGYWVVGSSLPVGETGFRYRAEGDAQWTVASVGANGDLSFSYHCEGLRSGTRYLVTAWIKIGETVYESVPPYGFTTEGEDTPDPDFDYTVNVSSIVNISGTGAEFRGVYSLSGGYGEVEAVGFKYRSGSGNWTSVTAADTSSPFSYDCTGLQPGTEYSVTAWIDVDGTVYEGGQVPYRFTTLATNPIEGKLWAELPEMDDRPNVIYVAHYVTEGGKRVRNYSLCYDRENLQSWWAAYPMHPFYDGGAGRNDAWKYDPDIPNAYQPNLSSSYTGTYSRGHQVASSDRQKSKTMNQQTFYYSNMAPQIQNGFNGGIWSTLETRIQNIGFNWSDTLYVVTGEAFIGNYNTTADKSGNTVPVPTHFYKVLLSSKRDNTGKPISQLRADELRCVGFWFEHKVYGSGSNPSANMKSVADIEALTGFTFFPMLSESARSVKNSYSASDWSGF